MKGLLCCIYSHSSFNTRITKKSPYRFYWLLLYIYLLLVIVLFSLSRKIDISRLLLFFFLTLWAHRCFQTKSINVHYHLSTKPKNSLKKRKKNKMIHCLKLQHWLLQKIGGRRQYQIAVLWSHVILGSQR